MKIRLIGVDAPESRNTRHKEKSKYGILAKDYLEGLIGSNRVKLEYDVDKYDRYGRILAYVLLKDGTFINAELVKQGYAVVMTVPPNVKHVDLFVELQNEARKKNRGFWKDEN